MNIFRKPLFIISASLLTMQNIQAQDGIPVYSDYLTDNYYLLHPSMAGASNCMKIRGNSRFNWIGDKGAPTVFTTTMDTRLGDRSGVGVTLFNDQNGYHSQAGAKLTYAHHITFSRSDYDLNMLSFGINAGMAQTTLNQTKFIGYPHDNLITPGVEVKAMNFMVDVGASYHFLDFFTHLTVKNAFSTNKEIYSDIESSNQRRYLLSAGYVIGNFTGFNNYRDSGFSWEPSVMLQYVEATKEKLADINMKMYKKFDNGQFYAGVSYRTSFDGAEHFNNNKSRQQYESSLSPLLGFKTGMFTMGYTYTHSLGAINYGKGMHQLSIGFNLLCKGSHYKCNCPSVNF